MRVHVIVSDVVVNTIEVPDGADPSQFDGVAADGMPSQIGIGWSYDGNDWIAPVDPEPSATIEDLRSAKIAAIVAASAALLAAGAPTASGLHIALDDGSRADLTAMAATATAAVSGAIPWPESYARGWITIENIRLPLATPAGGLTLAAAVGNYYAAIVQHRRDLKNAALAAADEAALDAVDINAGWPV